MRLVICGFVAGAGLLQVQPYLPSDATLIASGLVALLLVVLRREWTVILAGVMSGFCWAALLAHLALASQLLPEDEGRDITVTGTIDSLPYAFERGVRFHFAVEAADGASGPVPRRVALAWYDGRRGEVAPQVRPGERWRLAVRLQRPHGNANPHGFDYEGWLLQQGVRATGYVRGSGAANVRLDPFVWRLRHVVERSRAHLRERILRALPDAPYAGVIVALVVGDQRAIDQSDWTVFNRTGIGHLISISGLHITMVAGGFAWIASFLWRRSFFTDAQLPLLLPAQKVAALVGAAVALLYVLLAGFGIPAQRTLYMLCVVAAAAWLGRLTGVSHVLCLALGTVVVLDPWAVLAPGFWLSFGAVAVMLYAGSGRVVPRAAGWRGMLQLGVRAQYAVTVGLVPLSLLLFAQVSIVSPLANAVAIPLISLAVTPLALVGSVLPAFPGDALLRLAHALVETLAGMLTHLAASKLAVWSAPAPSAWMFAFALGGTAWMLAPRGWPLRWTGALAWLPLLLAQPARPPAGQFVVTAFDVGQGTALLIETAGHRLLYDTGPRYGLESDAGKRVILPYLKGRGIERIDTLVVSHSDADHSGGAASVLEGVRVGFLLSSLPGEHAIVRRAPSHALCAAGQRWHWDGVRFEVLHPTPASYGYATLKPNARSCMLRIAAGNHSILLTGDIEAAQESGLLADGVALGASVLLAPHHGSGTSSSAAFLSAVRPRIALFQVGHRNRYGHPKREVFERYAQHDIERLRTDTAGAIRLTFGESVTVERYRDTHRRYWFDQAP